MVLIGLFGLGRSWDSLPTDDRPRVLYSVLLGLMMSDGTIRANSEAARSFALGMSSKPLSFDICVLVAILLEISCLGYGMVSRKDIRMANGKVVQGLETTSITSLVFNRLWSVWYRDLDMELFGGSKSKAQHGRVLHPNVLALFDALAVCYAFLGDGHMQSKTQLLITTASYPVSSVDAFIAHLNSLFGINAGKQVDHKNQRLMLPTRYKVYIGPTSSRQFAGEIFPYMPASGWYKLPSNFEVPTSVPLGMDGQTLMNRINQIWQQGQ